MPGQVHGTSPATSPALVIGGGCAGLAAATALAEAGRRVVLLEARPHLGGRARSWVDPDTGSVVDNGQHLFMGCYRETLRLLRRLGTIDRLELQPACDVPFAERGGRVAAFRLPPAPYPINLLAGLLRFPGLGWRERLGTLRVALATLRHRGGAAGLDDRTVAAWLDGLGQGRGARARFWDPLAIATLNEDPERASAACFLPVLRAILLGGTGASRFGLARTGLSDLYAEPAAHFLRSRGCEVHLRAQVRQILVEGGRPIGVLLSDGAVRRGGPVIVAVPPAELLEILPEAIAVGMSFARLAGLEASPIVSLYLWFGAEVVDQPFAGLVGGTWHWIFNRRGLSATGSGHAVTLVRSAARELVDLPRDALVRSGLQDLHDFFPRSRRATLRQALVIKERRATFAPAPGTARLRPPFRTEVPGLYLAGDWTGTGLPATIEGAVLSGHACARLALAERG